MLEDHERKRATFGHRGADAAKSRTNLYDASSQTRRSPIEKYLAIVTPHATPDDVLDGDHDVAVQTIQYVAILGEV